MIAQIERPASPVETFASRSGDVWRLVDDLLARVWAKYAASAVTSRDGAWTAVFESPEAALGAALEASAAPRTVQWPGRNEVRIRLGVHTGRLRTSSSGFWGEDLHYAVRLAGAAHGGQVLVSAATAALVPGTVLFDLGRHRIEDFAVPRRLIGLGPGPHRLPRSGDPLRTNLPAQGRRTSNASK